MLTENGPLQREIPRIYYTCSFKHRLPGRMTFRKRFYTLYTLYTRGGQRGSLCVPLFMWATGKGTLQTQDFVVTLFNNLALSMKA